jgi:hypothetical protein
VTSPPSAGARLGACFGVLILVASVAQAKSGRFDALEMIVLSSERIALGTVVGHRDSMYAAPAEYGDRTVRFRVRTWLLGAGGAVDSVTMIVHRADPAPLDGDSILVLGVLRIRPGVLEPPRYLPAFDLTHPERIPSSFAMTREFRLLHDRRSILAAVRRRVAMIRDRRPLGDDRYFSAEQFASGAGRIGEGMPVDSETQRATYMGSINSLEYPADADLLPRFMRMTRAEEPHVRAWAAAQLAHYPRDSVVTRLNELLGDRGVSLHRTRGKSGTEDSTYVPIVRLSARHALRVLGVPDSELPPETDPPAPPR